jgi:hypothetical protein
MFKTNCSAIEQAFIFQLGKLFKENKKLIVKAKIKTALNYLS